MGVAYDLFWTLNPKSLSPFTEAFYLKQQYDDTVSWTQGLYIKMAIAGLIDSKVDYPKSPFSVVSKNKKEKVIMTQEDIIKDKFIHAMISINANFGKEAINESE